MESKRAKALLLAAGEGSRLRPLTLTRPKPMLPIGDRPLLEHLMDGLRRSGIRQAAINLHYRGDVVTGYFGDGSGFGMELTYSHEDPILGTAGALRKLAAYFDGCPAVVVYGDVLNTVDLDRLMAFHEANQRAHRLPVLSLSLYEPINPRECGIVDLAAGGRILRLQEKPTDATLFSTLSFSGVMVVDPRAIDLIPPGVFYDFGYHMFPDLLARDFPLYGLPIAGPEYVIDIGTPERYQRACEEWARRSAQAGTVECSIC